MRVHSRMTVSGLSTPERWTRTRRWSPTRNVCARRALQRVRSSLRSSTCTISRYVMGFEVVSLLDVFRRLQGWSCLKKRGHIIPRRRTTRLRTAKITLRSTGKPVCVSVSVSLDGCYRVWFRPRVLRDVTRVDWSTTILGHKTSMPLYIVRILL